MLVCRAGPPGGRVRPLRPPPPRACEPLPTPRLGSFQPERRSGVRRWETIIPASSFSSPSRPRLRPRPPLSRDQPDDPPAVG